MGRGRWVRVLGEASLNQPSVSVSPLHLPHKSSWLLTILPQLNSAFSLAASDHLWQWAYLKWAQGHVFPWFKSKFIPSSLSKRLHFLLSPFGLSISLGPFPSIVLADEEEGELWGAGYRARTLKRTLSMSIRNSPGKRWFETQWPLRRWLALIFCSSPELKQL